MPTPAPSLPFLTPELPGVGGTLRHVPEDFCVEEVPAYPPSGEGTHLFVWIEKRGRNTRDVVKELARLAGVPDREVGCAGLKDRHAVTRQWLSIPLKPGLDAAGFEGEGWKVLDATPHGNKLRTGHLRGNRFVIRLRGTVPDAASRALAVAEALKARGFANFFGPQRFGHDGRNVEMGRRLLSGERGGELERIRRDRFMRRLYLSAVQADLFNQVLSRRIEDGLFAAAVDGDVLKKLETGGLFLCDAPGVDSPRVASFELSATGPIFGHRLMEPERAAGEREATILQGAGLTRDSFAPFGADATGTRRAMRLPLAMEIAPEADGLVLSFSLEKGCYATAVLREVMKEETALADEEGRVDA